MKYLSRLLLALASWLPAHLAFSQSQFAVGLSGGLNLATQDYELESGLFDIDYDWATQFRTAAHAEWRFARRFSVGLEFGYAQKGNKDNDIEITDANGSVIAGAKARTVFRYFEQNTLVKYRFSSQKIRPYLLLGSSFGYLSGGQTKLLNFKIEGIDQTDFTTDLPVGQYNRGDFSLLGGGGVEIAVGKRGFLFAEARYQHGLTDLFKSDAVTLSNRNLSFTAGYAFLLGAE